jgi:lipid II:glycine glycyltransferase (peptidoglycan interpeptide bridge formation enzyme)
LGALLGELTVKRSSAGWNYIELRPRYAELDYAADLGYAPDAEFFFHSLDLRPDIPELYRRSHPDCVRRKIRRAEREGLVCESGSSPDLLRMFYSLLIKTRRRHGVPPQPFTWFENLMNCLGTQLQIRVALKESTPVAAIVTLTFKDTMTYKYGASDSRFHNLGGMPFLFWHAIQEAHAAGFSELDLGRSDPDNPGLLAFKEHLGAERKSLRYLRCPGRKEHCLSSSLGISWLRKRVCAILPDTLFCTLGRWLYPHCA